MSSRKSSEQLFGFTGISASSDVFETHPNRVGSGGRKQTDGGVIHNQLLLEDTLQGIRVSMPRSGQALFKVTEGPGEPSVKRSPHIFIVYKEEASPASVVHE